MLYQKSELWSQRPSDLLGIEPDGNEYIRHCIDNAVLIFGKWVTGRHSETEQVGKRGTVRSKYTIKQLVYDEISEVVKPVDQSDAKTAVPVHKTKSTKGFGSVASLMR